MNNFFFVITILVTIVFTFLYFKLNRKNYFFYISVLILIFFSIVILVALSFGTFYTIIYPLLIISILMIAIIFDIRKAQLFTIVTFIIFVLISILHNLNVLKFNPVITGSDFENTLITFALLWIIVSITKIGFSEIESSYNKALEYSKKMEDLNKELDTRVKKRTKIIQDNYENQIESVYSTSVIGSITRPLLHDIANPISALLGTIDLMDQSKAKDPKLLELAKQSTEQLYNILMESRELIRGTEINDSFDVNVNVEKCVKILQSELNRSMIKIKFEHENSTILYGVKSLFDRIIINVLVNAMEELRTIERERSIEIRINSIKDFVVVRIKDNGNGISKDNLLKIFDSDFSLKNTAHNLGLGLPFVKKIIETKFGGNIKIESEIGKFAEVILSFKNEKKK